MEYGSTENWQRGAVPMRKELEDKLAHRWPSWFNLGGDPMSSATARGFECGGGGSSSSGGCARRWSLLWRRWTKGQESDSR